MFEDLEGMYAFALLDETRQRLLLARDRFGEKPLYWAHTRAGLIFASEMKALFPFPGLDARLDVAAIAQFLALRYIPAPRTHLTGIRKLKAGEVLTADAVSGISCRHYWRSEVPAEGSLLSLSKHEAVDELRRLLMNSVRLRLRSDVPVAAFLSGGVDSTFVVSCARELMAGAKLTTFCASFDDEKLNEAPYARMVAEHIASDHHEVHFSSEQMLLSFNALIDHYDEPFADASMFPTFAVSHAARQHSKVMLSGDGGDECFAGYREFFRYYSFHSWRRIPGVNRFARALRSMWGKSWRGQGVLGFLSSTDWELLYPNRLRGELLDVFRADARSAAKEGLDELHANALWHARLPYPRSAIEAITQSYLPDQILVKVDRASMLSALECRAPFLDRGVVEFARKLPDQYLYERGKGKALLRHALPEWVPDQIRWRGKQGFTPPLAAWLRGALRTPMQDALSSFPACLKEVIDPAPALRLFQEHQNGVDHSDHLFRWLVLSRRCREMKPV
jgi:asparagine synthase (glutamine-hydrolysing)